MIPKIIHYCWFGGAEIPQEYQEYISEWLILHPGWKIIKWDEQNYSKWQAYLQNASSLRNWANISNLVRLEVLQDYGGIYLDTDIKLLKPLDNFLHYDCFLGFENEEEDPDLLSVNNAVMGCIPSHPFVTKCINYLLNTFQGDEPANESSPKLITHVLKSEYGLKKYGYQTLKENVTVLSKNVFYPISWNRVKQTHNYESFLTKESVAVHMWGRTWYTPKKMLAIIDELQNWTYEQENYIKQLKDHAENVQKLNEQINSDKDELERKVTEQKTILIKQEDLNKKEKDAQKILLDEQKKATQEQIKKYEEVNILLRERSNQLRLLTERWESADAMFSEILKKKDAKIDKLENSIIDLTKELNNTVIKLSEIEYTLKQQIKYNQVRIANQEENLKTKKEEIRCVEYSLENAKKEISQLNTTLYLLTESNKSEKEKIKESKTINSELLHQNRNLKIELQNLDEQYKLSKLRIKEMENSISWYQRTYEYRSFFGLVKEKLLKNKRPF